MQRAAPKLRQRKVLKSSARARDMDKAISADEMVEAARIIQTSDPGALQHTATHCNTLQHTATHCNAI